VNLFAARRADIEGFARDLEARGRARAAVTRRLCTNPTAVTVTDSDRKVNANRRLIRGCSRWVTCRSGAGTVVLCLALLRGPRFTAFRT
jgi:hypothetical protein